MNASGSLRVGLVGYGYAGRGIHAPLIGAVPGLELAAVASGRPDRVHEDHPGLPVEAEPLLLMQRPDIDLVVLATPPATHAALAEAALRAGKHVVVEKPFVLDLAEARVLAQCAHSCERVLSVFQNRRWDSDFLAVREAIGAGQIGRIVHFESHFDRYRPEVRERWREQDVPGAGPWFDLGPHLIDQALVLFGLPERVLLHGAAQRDGAHIDDWFHALLDYGSLQVVLHAGMLVAGASPRFTLHGDRGSACKAGLDIQEDQLRQGLLPGCDGWGEDPGELALFDAQGRRNSMRAPRGDYRRYYAALRDAVLAKGPNPVPPAEALAVMAVIEAGIASRQRGAFQPLALLAEEHEQAMSAFPPAG